MSEPKVYYQYLDESTGKYYFMDANTRETHRKIEPDSVVCDPTTSEEIQVDPEYIRKPSKKGKKKHTRQSSRTAVPKADPDAAEKKSKPSEPETSVKPSDHNEDVNQEKQNVTESPESTEEPAQKVPPSESVEDLVIDVEPDVEKFDISKAQKGPVGFQREHSYMPAEDGNPPYLPPDLQQEIHQFQFEDFAKNWFKEHRVERKLSRKLVSFQMLTEFSSETIAEPIIECNDPATSKLALQCFKWILNYTKVIKATRPEQYAQRIVDCCYNNSRLRDEVYFQLIKQTRNNSNHECLMATWDLLLIMCSVFPSTQNSELFIQNHLATQAKSSDEDVATIAQFCYIRFCARNAVGKPFESTEISWIKKILGSHLTGHQQFGASIYEQIFNQRRSLRHMPIPFIEYHMSEKLLQKGATTTQGIFRLPGNMKNVDEIAEATNIGRDMISPAPLNDICSLFKKWFRDLPDPVVQVRSLGRLETAYETKDYVSFANSMPRAHRLTLMFLIGFLQELSKHREVTQMTPKNFAICFGPNIVQPPDNTDAKRMKMFSDIAIEFITTLIDRWDTTPIYPMPKEYLRE